MYRPGDRIRHRSDPLVRGEVRSYAFRVERGYAYIVKWDDYAKESRHTQEFIEQFYVRDTGVR